MTDPTDEILMAFADEALAPAEHARIAAIVAKRPDLQDRVAVFAATSSREISPLFDKPLREPVPQHIIDTVMGRGGSSDAAVTRGARADDDGLWQRVTGGFFQFRPTFASAIACSVALVAGCAIGWYLAEPAATIAPEAAVAFDADPLAAGVSLSRALETLPSGTPADLTPVRDGQPATRVKVVLTFKNADEFCRQYEIAVNGGQGAVGLACRQSQGQWRVLAQAPAAVRFDAPPATSPSRDRWGLVGKIVIDMMKGEALDPPEEAVHIQQGWR